MKSPRNNAVSIRQRLLSHSKANKKPFNEVLQYYAMERFLYRLSLSQHKNKFILKGVLMLRLWDASESRPTMDIIKGVRMFLYPLVSALFNQIPLPKNGMV